jgi:predicted small lipoprotein YifL
MDIPARRFATRRSLPLIVASVAMLAMAGCSQQGPTPPPAPSPAEQAAANEAAAQKEFKLYQQMLDQHSDALAAPVGQEIVQKYPDTKAAAEVRKTLADVQARSRAQAEHERLAGLWYYQTADVEGLQHTASIYATGKPRGQSTRLVLRRHVKWGQSAYLFAPGGSKGFVCKGSCTVVMHVDGKRETWKAYLPKTGEPAMFIEHDKAFIAMLEKAKVIEMDVTTRDHGKETLEFEVGGYDPSKFLPLAKK